MKKLFGLLALFLLIYVVIKMGGTEIEQNIEKEKELETMFVSQDIDTRIFFYKGKLIDSNMLLIKKTTELNNDEFMKFKETFDFENNTYIIVNCQDKDVSEVITEEISEDGVSFEFIYEEKENSDNSVLIEIDNLKITNLNFIKINF